MLASILGSEPKRIEVVDRRTGKTFVETVFGEGAMRVFYGNPAGLAFTSRFLTAQWISRAYGSYHDKPASVKKIRSFIDGLSIDVNECEKPVEEYTSFNDFFARKLKSDRRPIASGPKSLASPADGRLLIFPRIDDTTVGFVKWAPISLRELFGEEKDLVDTYRDGSCMIVRLCPADYHRFHFPVSGKAGPTREIKGRLHSVSPYALEAKVPVYCMNKRTACSIQSPEFGKVLFMEIGALLVGGIVQTYTPGDVVTKGDEKGYFKFGGSTVIVFFEKGRVVFDNDLISNSAQGLETLVMMGEQLGQVMLSRTN